MANIGTLLKVEIARLARREIRQYTEPFKMASASHRRQIATLKRQVIALQREVLTLGRSRGKAVAMPPVDGATTRFVAKGLKTLRARLGLSAAELGTLIGVSGQSVYNWEAKKSVPRKAQVIAIAALRPLGKREVRERLEQRAAKPAGRATRAR